MTPLNWVTSGLLILAELGKNGNKLVQRRVARLTAKCCVHSKCRFVFSAVPAWEGDGASVSWWEVLHKWRRSIFFFNQMYFIRVLLSWNSRNFEQENVGGSHQRGALGTEDLAKCELVRKQTVGILVLARRFCAFQVTGFFSSKI